MKNREEFKNEMTDFLESNNSVGLITGLDDDKKIVVTLLLLTTKYSQGTLYVNNIGEAGKSLHEAFQKYNMKFSKDITMTRPYNVKNSRINFIKYSKKLLGNISEEDDFALFYPVQNALFDDKGFKNLSNHIDKSKANKTIIVTTNDHFSNTQRLNKYVDRHIHFDCKEDNPEFYNTVKKILGNSLYDQEINPIYKEFREFRKEKNKNEGR